MATSMNSLRIGSKGTHTMVRLGAEVAVVLFWFGCAAYSSAGFYLRWPISDIVWLGAACGFYAVMQINIERIFVELR